MRDGERAGGGGGAGDGGGAGGGGGDGGCGGAGSGAGAGSSAGTVFASGSVEERPLVVRKNSQHSPEVRKVLEKSVPRKVESFRFNPNTVSIEDLQRLGFSEKQAQSIDNYRQKGGRFRRKSDFAKSYVVADSVYRRLEPHIDIPRLDINKADSAAFTTLPGIGKFFAAKMVEHREELHGIVLYRDNQPRELWTLDGLLSAGVISPDQHRQLSLCRLE